MGFSEIPESILSKIFYLCPEDLYQCEAVCRNWRNLLLADINLWHYAMLGNELNTSNINWRNECYKLAKLPCKEVLNQKVQNFHRDRVLHVSFSHDGLLLATCSKDAYIQVWRLDDYQIRPLYSHYMMEPLNWDYTQSSSFNASDTLLLVLGVARTSSTVAVFDLQDGFTLQYEEKGPIYIATWLNDNLLLTGKIHKFDGSMARITFWISSARMKLENFRKWINLLTLKFFNFNGSLIQNVIVTNIKTPLQKDGNVESDSSINSLTSNYNKLCVDSHDDSIVQKNGDSNDVNGKMCTKKYLIFTTGSRCYVPHQIGFKHIPKPQQLPPEWKSLKKDILYDLDKKIRTELKDLTYNETLRLNSKFRSRLPRNEKELLYVLQSYNMEFMPDYLFNGNVGSSPLVGSSNLEATRLPYSDPYIMNFDTIDTVLEMNGHIVGLSLDKDNRWLYANVRPWSCVPGDPFYPPAMASECEIRVIDLHTLTMVQNVIYTSHFAYSTVEECFLSIDSCSDFISSGSENESAYIWDKSNNNCIAKLAHGSVVNCAAFCPTDPEICVTVGNDHQIKVWVSRRKSAKLYRKTPESSSEDLSSD